MVTTPAARDDIAVQLKRNRLLAALPEKERLDLAPYLHRKHYSRGEVLFNPGEDMQTVYFPCTSMVSIVVVMPTGQTAEAGFVGPEGVIGGLISYGNKPAFSRAIVQIPGDILTIGIAAIEAAKARSTGIQDLFARYADCFLATIMQSIACNATHGLEQRLPRWLLSVQNRLGGEEIVLTHATLAEMLGVQRTSVTAAAVGLQKRGLMNYARGRIRLLDVAALEKESCPCHRRVRTHFDRLLPGVYTATD